jgi:hypothetical protein
LRSVGHPLLRALKLGVVVESGAVTALAGLGQLVVRYDGPVAAAASAVQDPLFLTQLPGLLLLSGLGLCCGSDGGSVTHDSPPHLLLRGAPLLGMANLPFVLALVLAALRIGRRMKARSSAA